MNIPGRGIRGKLLSSMLCVWASTAMAIDATPLTLAEAERLALEQEPGELALTSRASAFGERAVAAAQLPDPKLRLGLANYPIESGGFSTEGMTQAQLGLRQSFPAGRSLAIRSQRMLSMADEMTEQAQARRRDVRLATRQAWLEAYYWQSAAEIVADSRPFFADLVTVTRSLYSVGRRDQQDLLRAELELARLDDRLMDINRERSLASAALSQWVGAAASAPLAQALPDWEEVPGADELRERLPAHPLLRAAQARVATGGAGVDLARERYKPGWDLDVGYGYREGELPDGDSRSDFVSVAVTFDLPLFRRNRQDRMVAAAVSDRAAAEASRDELLRRLDGQVQAEHARWLELNRRIALYEAQIIDQAAAQAQAALTAYQSDAGDFADVMRGFIDDLDTRLAYVRLGTERAQSYAALASLGGFDND